MKKIFWLAMLLLAASAMGSTVTLQTNSLEAVGLKMVGSASPEFQNLALRVHTPVQLEHLGSMLPYAVIVTNTSRSPMLAVLIRYEIQLATGKAIHWNLLRSGWQLLGRQTLAPGQSHLIVPSPEASVSLNTTGYSYHTGESGGSLAAALATTISLDSVLFADGQFYGPDRSKSFQRYTAWHSAALNLISELSQLAAKGASDEQITGVLQSKQPLADQIFEDRNHYSRRQFELSRLLLSVLRARGRTGLNQTIAQAQLQEGFTLVRR